VYAKLQVLDRKNYLFFTIGGSALQTEPPLPPPPPYCHSVLEYQYTQTLTLEFSVRIASMEIFLNSASEAEFKKISMEAIMTLHSCVSACVYWYSRTLWQQGGGGGRGGLASGAEPSIVKINNFCRWFLALRLQTLLPGSGKFHYFA